MTTPTTKHLRTKPRSATMVALALASTGFMLVGVNTLMPATAYAAAPEAFPSDTVHYRDLDLSTEKGAAILHIRIRRAARNVCGENTTSLTPWSNRRYTCIMETTRIAQAQADRIIVRHRAASLAKD